MADKNARIAGYTLLRLAIGMSMMIHGFNRIGHMPAFADKTIKEFNGTWLPRVSLSAFSYATPPVELAIGLLVFFGLFTRFGLILGGLWMVLLIFGSALIAKYDLVGIQLVYSLIFSALLFCLELNDISIDRLIIRKYHTT